MASAAAARSRPPDAPGAAGSLALRGEDDHGFFLEPGVACCLLPHQREGVRFMYSHIFRGRGCILADVMGLGKTVQALCLIWAALSRPSQRPLCRRAAVACPSSLCVHWEAECERWLGPLRVRPLVVHGGGPAAGAASIVRGFVASGRLLVISYDQLRVHAGSLAGAIDLLVCDEGHRLGSADTATTRSLGALRCGRRVLLTGTPLQNRLEELWHCVDFVQPGLLGPLRQFQQLAQPLVRAQDATASAAEVQAGAQRAAELWRRTSGVVLRRGPELLEAVLPPKVELLWTVPLTPAQVASYRALCAAARGGDGSALTLVVALRQLCSADPRDAREGAPEPEACEGQAHEAEANEWRGPAAATRQHPEDSAGDFEWARRALERSGPRLESGAAAAHAASAKLLLLGALLRWARRAVPEEAFVVVSGFTRSLRRCSALCQDLGIPADMLSGSTPIRSRLELVSAFNAGRGCRVMLLSSRAGGVGLNIVGASRLVLLEPDWNPAVDQQAAARVWRQGQRRRVFVYRLAAHGTLEERVLRRQARKRGLASAALEPDEWECGAAVDDALDLRQICALHGYDAAGAPIPWADPAGAGPSVDAATLGEAEHAASGAADAGVRAALIGARPL